MRRIHEFDTSLRKAFESGAHDGGVCFIRTDERNRIIPCSPNKVLVSDIIALRPFNRYVPYGFQTIAPSSLNKLVASIDKEIARLHTGEGDTPVLITVQQGEDLLKMVSTTLKFETGYEFDRKTILASTNFISTNSGDANMRGKIWLLVRTDRNNSRMRADGLRYFDSPDTAQREGRIARETADTIPLVMMLRQNGSVENGWRGGAFWWPVVVAPRNTKTAIFAASYAK